MSDPRPIRITNPESEQWIEENIPKGKFNEWVNQQIDLGVRNGIIDNITEELNEKTDRRISLFSMVMFLLIGAVFILFALSPYNIIIQTLASILFFTTGVLLFIYVYINRGKPQKEKI